MAPPHWPSWPLPLPPSSMSAAGQHSNEVERRLTLQEEASKHVNTRLTRLEKIVLAIVAALNILAHDKLPEWARGLSLLLKAWM